MASLITIQAFLIMLIIQVTDRTKVQADQVTLRAQDIISRGDAKTCVISIILDFY